MIKMNPSGSFYFYFFVENNTSRKGMIAVMDDKNSLKSKENDILRVLYENRGNRPLILKEIRNGMNEPEKPRHINNLIRPLIDRCYVSVLQKKIDSSEQFYITDQGVEYIQNNYTAIKKDNKDLQNISCELRRMNENFLRFMDELLKKYDLSQQEQIQKEKLLIELSKATTEKNQNNEDKKINKILKEALDAGKGIFIPLAVEYIKSEARKLGVML